MITLIIHVAWTRITISAHNMEFIHSRRVSLPNLNRLDGSLSVGCWQLWLESMHYSIPTSIPLSSDCLHLVPLCFLPTPTPSNIGGSVSLPFSLSGDPLWLEACTL